MNGADKYDRVSQDNTIFTDVDRYNGFGDCLNATKTVAFAIVFVAFCICMAYYISQDGVIL